MMRLLLAAGADPAQVTDTKTTPVMAASGLNRGIGESPITEEQALAAVKFLLELGADAKGATTNGENALFGAAYRGWNTLLALLIDKGADVNAVSKAGVTPWLAASGLRRSTGRRPLQQGGCGSAARARRRSEARKTLSGAEQVPVRCRRNWTDDGGRRDVACIGVRWPGAVCVHGVERHVRKRGVSARRSGSVPRPQLPRVNWSRKYCVTCHNERLKTANLLLDKADAEQVFNSAETWEKVIVKLRSRAMPPSGMPRPDNATYDAVADVAGDGTGSCGAAHPESGSAGGLHRLNRTEYANAVRDLLGIEIDPRRCCRRTRRRTGSTPTLTRLSMEPALLDRYLTAAAKIARARRSATRRCARRSSATPRSRATRMNRRGSGRPSVLAKTFHWARAAASRRAIISRSMASTSSGFGCCRTYAGVIRGLNAPTRSRFVWMARASDSSRLVASEPGRPERRLQTVPMPTDPSDEADEALQVRVPLKAGLRQVVATIVKSDGSQTRGTGPGSRSDLEPRR